MKNQNQQELCDKLGMKYDEVSELFGNETLQEMQMAQISGGVVCITDAHFYTMESTMNGGTLYKFYRYSTISPPQSYQIGAVIVEYSPTFGYSINGVNATGYEIKQVENVWGGAPSYEFHYYTDASPSGSPVDPSGGF